MSSRAKPASSRNGKTSCATSTACNTGLIPKKARRKTATIQLRTHVVEHGKIL